MNTAYQSALDTRQREFARRLEFLNRSFTGYSPVPTARDRHALAPAPAERAPGVLRTGALRAWRALGDWRLRRRAIAQLRALDTHLLEDIGITRESIPAAVAGSWQRAAAPTPAPERVWRAPPGLRAANRRRFRDAA